jgi:tRNA modification GTPase
MAEADLTIVVLDLSEEFSDSDVDLLQLADNQGSPIVVGNKCDLPRRLHGQRELLEVSAKGGEGVEELRRELVRRIAPHGFLSPQSGLITSLRHERLLRESREALDRAEEASGFGLPHELLLLDCYAALRPIDALTGATTADDILNHIFSTFCIGK